MERSAFFNSSGGDRVYDAAAFAWYFSKILSNGILFGPAASLKITLREGMAVQAAPGSAWINGYAYENTSDLELPLEIANGIHLRIDRVVLRWSAIDREIRLAVKTGVASGEPSAPLLIRNNDVYELGLADITVAKGVISITEDAIIDTRMNPELCGQADSRVNAVYE